MSNHLANQNSPYLLQHKDNPVDWYPWGEEALSKAKEEQKPIFLSIGYAACHWCHVMEHESFENQETAAMLNEHFISIKVDREERPDLDQIYMKAVVALTGQGGWPMSVFLTPDLQPFFGGTYFPPMQRHGLPSFTQVLSKIAELWAKKPEELLDSGRQLVEHLESMQIDAVGGDPLTPHTLVSAKARLVANYDWAHGGWGAAPKFPQPMSLLFLLRQATAGDEEALKESRHALDAMAQGGMYDLIGGGFARYSVDANWLVPHFEKMLYDNALLARAYLHAYLLTGETYYRQVCQQTLDFVLREMTHPQGGFFSSIDADSEGEEGKFYIWEYAELKEHLTNQEFKLLKETLELPEGGNFEGKLVLRRKSSGPSPEADELAAIYHKLFEIRSRRKRPSTDDKVLVAWNAWMAITFAEAARYLDHPGYLKACQDNLTFLLEALEKDGRLLRSWRDGQAQHQAYLEDYAGLILALLSLYQSDHQTRWYHEAQRLTDQMIDLFSDQDGQFYDTSQDQPYLLLRPREIRDNATPSGTSLAAQALLMMEAFSGNGRYHDLAVKALEPIQSLLAEYPTAFGNWLAALDFALGDGVEIALLGDLENAAAVEMKDAIWSKLRPHAILAASIYPPAQGAPPLLENRELINGQPTAYVCRSFACRQPTTDSDEFKQQLAESS